MKSSSNLEESVITAKALQDLPQSVQRYFEYTSVVGFPWIHKVHLQQEGRFRQGLDRPWMPLKAVETYTVDPPGLVWDASFRLSGLPLLRARDTYEAGHGHMYGKLAGLFTVFDARGDELDQATMIRYLNEMMWFPTALLGKNVSWREIDPRSAEVTFTDHGKSVSGKMFFDDAGRLTNFTTMRYREIDGDFSLDPWSTPILNYGERASLNLPIRGAAVWNLESGDLPYAELEITEVEYEFAT